MKSSPKRPVQLALLVAPLLVQNASAHTSSPRSETVHAAHGDHATDMQPAAQAQDGIAPREAKQTPSIAPSAKAAAKMQGQHQGHADAHGGHAAPALTRQEATSGAAGTIPAMDHAAMEHSPAQAARHAADHGGMAPVPNAAGSSPGMQMGRMQGGPPPPDARDPDAYNDGTRFAHLGNHEMNDNAPFWKVLVDKAEAATGDGEHGQNVELEAWYGNDYNKAWVKVEGERRGGALESARTELLWDRAFATFWSTQLGIRHDSGEGKSRDWLAFGVQGLAPYWFETEATAYWRGGSGLAVRLNAKYEVLLTSRLILEPEVGANLYSRSDSERATGSGLSDLNVGLRLRYEITRQVAPYVGVTWRRQFGKTADLTRWRGGDTNQVQAVAGIRFWF